MKNTSLLILSLGITLFLAACQSNDHYKEDIIGKWKVNKWLIGSEDENRQFLDATFSFLENGRYDIDYTTQKEEGVYRVSGSKLYTTEDGQIEKMVKITKLNTDSLIFQMNRAGSLETLVLIKE